MKAGVNADDETVFTLSDLTPLCSTCVNIHKNKAGYPSRVRVGRAAKNYFTKHLGEAVMKKCNPRTYGPSDVAD